MRRNSRNPVLSDKAFTGFDLAAGERPMTVSGTIFKSYILLAVLGLAAIATWVAMFDVAIAQLFLQYYWVLLLGALGVAILTVFKRQWAAYTSGLYALLEGSLLGGISWLFEAQYGGIVFQAILLTFGVLIVMLTLYTSRIITVTQKFRSVVIMGTGAVMLLYLGSWILGFFGVNIGFLHDSSIFGIVFNLFVIVLAALNLLLDFDFIERGAQSGAPKYMEWYSAFGLMVTLIWLYLEILRLLSRSRRR
ncbi:MAG: Bax inhibitor-1/YccA family protein [Anaerolineae bacterium]|nr:MAG: Bax inhibitor-1/YccA family protein [Anaerolineae bacterium]